MPATPRITLYIRTGDTHTVRVPMLDEAGEPRDITGMDYRAQLRTLPPSATALADYDVTIEDPAAGVVVLNLDADTTAGLPTGTVWMDLEESDGDVVTTLFEAKVKIKKDVTR